MLVDEIVDYEPRRETLPAAQVMVQEASPISQILEPSTSRTPRTLKKPKAARVQQGHYYYPSPSTPSSIALTRTSLAPIRTPSDASGGSPIQSPSSSSSSRKLLKSQQKSTVPLINPPYPSLSSPAPPASASMSGPVSPRIPPPIPQIQTRLSGLPDERVQNPTQFGSPERPWPAPTPTSTRPLRSPLTSFGTPIVGISSEPGKTGVNPPLVPRYSNVKNKRWALWTLYLLLGLGNLILVLRLRSSFPKWSSLEPSTGTSTAKRTGTHDSQPPRELMDLWKIAPLVNVLVTSGLLAIYWGLDKWYPVTFVSRPLPEMLFYLVLFGIQIATVKEQSLNVGPSIQWLIDTHRLGPQDREELKVEARVSSAFMSIQALIVLLAFGVVAYHVVHHIRHDRDRPKTSHLNVLKHPTCRYIPHALPASAFFASPFDSTRFKNEISSTSPLV